MIGYAWNDGGLNNQKLALLGLMIEASRSGSAVYLPQIYSKDQRDQRSGLFDFADIFCFDQFRDFATRWNVAIVDVPILCPMPTELSGVDGVISILALGISPIFG